MKYEEKERQHTWRDEAPTLKQIEWFAKLSEDAEYEPKHWPETKGEYVDEINYLITRSMTNRY